MLAPRLGMYESCPYSLRHCGLSAHPCGMIGSDIAIELLGRSEVLVACYVLLDLGERLLP